MNSIFKEQTANYIKFLVQKLSVCLIGRNITMDRLYISFKIADWLLERKITTLATMQSNWVGIPPEILSTKMYWEKNGSRDISSYVAKTSKGKKSIIVPSTTNPIREVMTIRKSLLHINYTILPKGSQIL